jgi:hypothetical protein
VVVRGYLFWCMSGSLAGQLFFQIFKWWIGGGGVIVVVAGVLQ